MIFKVNNTEFKSEICLDDTLNISSLKNDYVVNYSSHTLIEIKILLYCQNDIIFIDRNVYNLDTTAFDDIYKKIFIFDAIEETKNMNSVLKFIDMLHENKFTKKNKVIVFGGGISQEVAGFACAIYKRGIDWFFVPTTILSMTDSCIGSKVSLNTTSKNMLGLFVAPNKIHISDYFLRSLKPDDIISGVGEAFKLSLIGGEETFTLFKEYLKKNDYINIIKIASLVKKEVIEYDEFEKSERKVLNYGHTIGHAIEATTLYLIPHGISVLIGMYIINKLFKPTSLIHNKINDLILELVDHKFFEISFDYEIFIQHILSDKKNDGENVCFIILEDIGFSIFEYKNINCVKEEIRVIIKNIFKSCV